MMFGMILMSLYTFNNFGDNMYYFAFLICLILGVCRGLQDLHTPPYRIKPSKNLLDFLFPGI
jgi:hypothetical protein